MGNWSPNLRDNDGGKVPQPSPPSELVLAWHCKEWNSLPYSGGLLDQPAGLMSRLSTLSSIHTAFRTWRDKKPGEEDKISEEIFAKINLVDKIREELNGTE